MTAQTDTAAERARQDAKWGEQNHPDGTGEGERPLLRISNRLGVPMHLAHAVDLATFATQNTNAAAGQGTVTWRDILLEEVFEALAESDPEALRTELIQVAAVAQQWAEAIDRREEQA